jgi:DNA-binding MarR family transcriptional regulator
MEETLVRFFLREKPTLALLALKEMEPTYAALITKRIDSTFPHTSRIISELEEHGLIASRPVGRIRYIELTDRGKRIAEALQELKVMLQKPGLQWNKLERLGEMQRKATMKDKSPLNLGPLRRDLAMLKGQGDDKLRQAAEDLDRIISAALDEIVS